MTSFNYRNYCTVYSVTGTVDQGMGTDCCFHTVTKDEGTKIMENDYTIRFAIGSDYMEATDNNNACFISEEDIKEHLRIINTIYPFTYTLNKYSTSIHDMEHDIDDYDDEDEDEDDDDEEDDNEHNNQEINYYELKVHIEGDIIYHKFILKMIRPFYEFPFNMALMDVIKLKKIPPFTLYGTINLYLMVGYICMQTRVGGNDDQFICCAENGFPLFKKKQEWIASLQEIANTINEPFEECINDLCYYIMTDEDLNNDYGIFSDGNKNQKELEFWTNEDNFNQRVEVYKKYLPKFKSSNKE